MCFMLAPPTLGSSAAAIAPLSGSSATLPKVEVQVFGSVSALSSRDRSAAAQRKQDPYGLQAAFAVSNALAAFFAAASEPKTINAYGCFKSRSITSPVLFLLQRCTANLLFDAA